MASVTHKIRIHGDNILECESTLKLMATSLNGGKFVLKCGPAYAPVYSIEASNGESFDIQLFAGYGRWKFPLAEYVASLGGMLREAPDAVITRIELVGGKEYERPILAVEFSGALPAGNNAWQRTGRALALAYAGIPYLYFADIGGQELDSLRKIKAARFPNPLVPFAYAVLGDSSGTTSLPIYSPSPSGSQSLIEVFDGCFGAEDSVLLTKAILLNEDTKSSKDSLEKKVLKILEVLSQERKRNDILEPKEWAELFSHKSGIDKAKWLITKAMPWSKKTGIKTLTPTFKKLIEIAKESGAVAIGSKEMPICLIPAEKRPVFASKVKTNYTVKIDEQFNTWIGTNSRPLICVWVAGFKPKGDDSRPDRGLVPLARMIFGIEDIDLLTIVYGPAQISTWDSLKLDMHKLATSNGLWESIVNLSDAIVVDSGTSTKLDSVGFLVTKKHPIEKGKLLPPASEVPNFGEHDIDSVLHLLFTHSSSSEQLYECMCNPPGGDWSGINILETQEGIELRWTSLPRVSGTDSKRPDHLIEFLDERTLLSIESKDTATKLESEIGPRLIRYVDSLLKSNPIAIRILNTGIWKRYEGETIQKFKLLSGGAFRYVNEENLKDTLKRASVDVAFGVEFIPSEKRTVIHITSNDAGRAYLDKITRLASTLDGIIEIEIHQ